VDARLLAWLRCPECRARLEADDRDALHCTGCGRRFAVRGGIPSFTAETSPTAAAFGYLWGAAEGSVHPPARAAHYHLQSMRDALGAPPLAGRVLDGGCGDGIDFAGVALDPACEVVGVELSDGGIATSRARTRGLERARLIQGDLLKLPLADDLFDAAYSYGVVHHTPDPQRAVGELGRVLKRGGTLLLYVYEDFSDRALHWRASLALVNSLRRVTTRTPLRLLMWMCRALSPVVYVTCTLPSRRFRFAARFPYRHGTSPWGLSGDLYDRFSAPIEYRYSERGARALAERAGLRVVRSAQRRGWMVWATKP
jgi:SAM-dependent methyltransferase